MWGLMAYRLLGEVVPDLAKINIIGVFFWAVAQNWWVTADGGVIYYTAILPKLWPTALGTDEGVRPPTGKSCTGPSNTDGSHAK